MCDSSMLGNLGLGAQAAGAVGSTYASYRQSQATAQGYEYQAAIARNNEQLSEWQAQDALLRGQNTQQKIQLGAAQLEGKQRSILAARNVALTEGSPLNILADTKFMAERDVLMAGDNTAKEAWALRNQSADYASNARLLQNRADAQSPFLDAAGTLLTSGGKVASSWYALRNPYSRLGA